MIEQRLLQSGTCEGLREAGSFGRPLHSLYPQLQQVIAGELGPEFQHLLAEPVVMESGARIDWYSAGDAEPLALAALPVDQRQPVYTRLLDAYDRLEALATRYLQSGDPTRLQLGRALRAALVPPADANVFVVDGRPVITFWGFFQDRDWGGPMDLERWRALRRGPPPAVEPPPAAVPPPPVPAAVAIPPPPAPIATAPPTPTATPAPPPPAPIATAPPPPPAGTAEATGRPRYVVVGSVFFWSVFIGALLLLLGVVLANFLIAPAADQNAQSTGAALPATVDADTVGAALARARTAETGLRARLDALRRQASERVQCPTAPAPATSQDFSNRLTEAGASEGEITVTLIWNDKNDLDLLITCPSGERLYYEHPRACNGTLDVDRNADRALTDHPVENVYWPVGKAAAGTYQVAVHYYARHDPGPPPETAFQLRLLQSGKTTLFSGVVAPSATRQVTTFTVTR